MPRSSTTVWALIDVASQQELRPRGSSAMLPLSPELKGAFDKFEQDFQAANLPEGKCIKKTCFHFQVVQIETTLF